MMTVMGIDMVLILAFIGVVVVFEGMSDSMGSDSAEPRGDGVGHPGPRSDLERT